MKNNSYIVLHLDRRSRWSLVQVVGTKEDVLTGLVSLLEYH